MDLPNGGVDEHAAKMRRTVEPRIDQSLVQCSDLNLFESHVGWTMWDGMYLILT